MLSALEFQPRWDDLDLKRWQGRRIGLVGGIAQHAHLESLRLVFAARASHERGEAADPTAIG